MDRLALVLYLGLMVSLMIVPPLRVKTIQIMHEWVRIFVETPLRIIAGRPRANHALIARLERETGVGSGSRA